MEQDRAVEALAALAQDTRLNVFRMLIRAARESGASLDWELIGGYLELFKMEARLGELKKLYGQAD